MKTILVCGGAGFIGHHLARRLMKEGHYVVVADIKKDDNYKSYCNDYHQVDLTDKRNWDMLASIYLFHEIYQLAADMGGAGYIFTGENDFNVMHNSGLINMHAVEFALFCGAKIFYSSSACMYPAYNQEDPNNPNCEEKSAYPAAPDSEYGWEKLFSERLYLAANRNRGLEVRIARFHNIFGPEGTWDGGKEKAPAALCRKIARSDGSIDIWGDGEQTRSFLYIDECLDGIQKLMKSNFTGPVNIGSEEMVTINELANMIAKIAHKGIKINHIKGPVGVRGRNSDNKLIFEKLGWKPTKPLSEGLKLTYHWIYSQIYPG